MTTRFQPPPTWAPPFIEIQGGQAYNPVWIKWFVDLVQWTEKAGFSGTIATAPLTSGGTTGSMTFVDGVLTEQILAT